MAKRKRAPRTNAMRLLDANRVTYEVLTFSSDIHSAAGVAEAVGLDRYVGFLHADVYNRPSLALDLEEEFRVLIEDLVFRLVRDQGITPDDFRPGEEGERALVMEKDAVKRLIQAYEKQMRRSRVHPRTNETLAQWRFLEIQAREIARCIRESEPGSYRALRFR